MLALEARARPRCPAATTRQRTCWAKVCRVQSSAAYPESFGLEQAQWTTQALASSVSFGVLPRGVCWSPGTAPAINALLIHLATLFE
jgi:hypothetical protein